MNQNTNPFVVRLKEYLTEKRIPVARFEQSVGASNGYIRGLRGTPKHDRLKRIGETYPDLNLEYLIYGTGSVYADPKETAQRSNLIPRIPASAASAVAGTLSGYADSVGATECEYAPAVTQLPRYDLTLTVSGDSMEPRFLSGDELALRQIEPKTMRYGETYVLSTPDGAVLKRIYPADTPDNIRLLSFNPDFPPYEIPRTDILESYSIVGLIRRLQ